MLDRAIGPNIIKGLIQGFEKFLDKNADNGWTSLDDLRGIGRDRVVLVACLR